MKGVPMPIPFLSREGPDKHPVETRAASGQADEHSYGGWYAWARREVAPASAERAHAAAWTAFKAFAAGHGQHEAVRLAKHVAWSGAMRSVAEGVDPQLRLYGDWMSWAIDNLGAPADTAHAAADAALAAISTGADQEAAGRAAQAAAGLRLAPFTPADPKRTRSALVSEMTLSVSKGFIGLALGVAVGGAVGAFVLGPVWGAISAALVLAAGFAALLYDRRHFPTAYFTFDGPVVITRERQTPRSPLQYHVRFGRLSAHLHDHSGQRLLHSPAQVSRILYHIRPTGMGANVTLLRAEAANGMIIYRNLRLDGEIDLLPSPGA